MHQNKVLLIGIKIEIVMSSRDKILARIKANKPSLIDLPIIEKELFVENKDHYSEFVKQVKGVGGVIKEVNSNKEVIAQLDKDFFEAENKYSNLEDTLYFNTIDVNQLESPNKLEDLDVFVTEGVFGVAENGAVWLTGSQIPIRVLPFITKHLVLVLEKSKIVSNLHLAYEKIEKTEYNFGIFISGPSKTADIEQSLVIGAQGALSLTIFIK